MSSDRYREKLLELIGKIGRDDRTGKTASKVKKKYIYIYVTDRFATAGPI